VRLCSVWPRGPGTPDESSGSISALGWIRGEKKAGDPENFSPSQGGEDAGRAVSRVLRAWPGHGGTAGQSPSSRTQALSCRWLFLAGSW
jgi:hypothetical protein